MSKMRDGGPAFACGDQGGYEAHSGMSLRDWFAGQALAGMLGNDGWAFDPPAQIALAAFAVADAMLEAREES